MFQSIFFFFFFFFFFVAQEDTKILNRSILILHYQMTKSSISSQISFSTKYSLLILPVLIEENGDDITYISNIATSSIIC